MLNILILTFVAVMFSAQQTKADIGNTNSIVREAREQWNAVDREWAKSDFHPLTEASLRDHLNALIADSKHGFSMTDEQASRLSDGVLTFLRAYSAGTYESYKAFRMPSGVSFDLTTNRLGSLNEALEMGKTFALPEALTRWGLLRQERTDWSKKSIDEKVLAYLKLYAGDTLYSNYFTAIAFDRSRIVFTNCTAHPIPLAVKTAFTPVSSNSNPFASAPVAFPNMGYFSQKHFTFINFKDSVEEVENQFGAVTLADCLLFLKRSDADGFLPVIVRFYWEPNRKRWLPDDLVVCNLNRKSDFWPLF
jgi:hypothetical protein